MPSAVSNMQEVHIKVLVLKPSRKLCSLSGSSWCPQLPLNLPSCPLPSLIKCFHFHLKCCFVSCWPPWPHGNISCLISKWSVSQETDIFMQIMERNISSMYDLQQEALRWEVPLEKKYWSIGINRLVISLDLICMSWHLINFFNFDWAVVAFLFLIVCR